MGNHYIRRFDLSKYTLKSFDSADEFACDTNNGDAITVNKNGTVAVVVDSQSAQLQGGIVAGAAVSSYTTVPKQITAVADDTATTLFTVTIPNPPASSFHTATIDLTVMGIAGAGGAIAAGESVSSAFYQIVVTRTPGVAAVAGLSTAASATAASAAVSGGDQVVTPLLVTLGAITGGATATETFTIQVTVDDDTGSATNHVVIGQATLLNANASGVTIA